MSFMPGRGVAASRGDDHIVGMRFEIEFFIETDDQSEGRTIRRNSGQFASERDVEIYGLTQRPEEADGFRILKDGVVRKTVSIESEKHEA
jgi:hypothetical protein